ncbi:hypothetical protein EAI_03882, partial [Harpegnathos saltator]
VPKGAIMLTRYEALTHQWNVVSDWKSQKDVWPLVHGCGILGIAAGLSGTYINYWFRQKLKARNIAVLPTMMMSALAPALLTGLFQSQMVMNKILLLEEPCPLCLQFKSALIQMSTGTLVPMIISPMVNFAVSINLVT